MTSSDWLTSTDPQTMIAFLQDNGRASQRKQRLFAAACSRRLWHLLVHDASREAIEVAERFAEGLATGDELYRANKAADEVRQFLPQAAGEASEACFAAVEAVPEDARDHLAAYFPAARAIGWVNATADVPDTQAEIAERSVQTAILRDIFGNPFHPLSPLSTALLEWQDRLILHLATAIYDNRLLPSGKLDPDRIAVLADALLDAGCTDAELLGHLRSEGSHYRGCRVLEAIMDRQ
jgi:hypothetical protein